MMMVALFGAAQAAEKFFLPICASAVHRISLFVIDALHFILGVQRIPRATFVSVDNRSLGDARAYEGKGLPFGAEHGRERAAIALAVLVASSRRKTSRAVMIRTITDGTTDMRECPRLDCAFYGNLATGLTRAPFIGLLFNPSYSRFTFRAQLSGVYVPAILDSAFRQNFYDILPNL
jgi:hypothetical protein